jgi:hypothetical protein
VLYVVIFMLIGLITVIWPRFWWNLTRWQYRHPEAVEPSDLAFTIGRAGGGLMILLGLVGLTMASGNRDRAATEEAEATSTTIPVGTLTADFSEKLLAYARTKGVPVRKLPPEEFAAQAGHGYNPYIQRTMDFGSTGQVDLHFSPPGGDVWRCVTFRDQGDAVTEDHVCIPPVANQRARVQKIADEIMAEAKAQNVSPRSEALAKKTAHRWITETRQVGASTYDIQRTGKLFVDYDQIGDTPDAMWCILLPEENTGTATVNQTRCP